MHAFGLGRRQGETTCQCRVEASHQLAQTQPLIGPVKKRADSLWRIAYDGWLHTYMDTSYVMYTVRASMYSYPSCDRWFM